MKLSIFDIPTECKGQRLLNISAILVILIFNNIHILLFNVSYPKGLTLITHQLVVNKVIFVQLSNQSNILVFVVKKNNNFSAHGSANSAIFVLWGPDPIMQRFDKCMPMRPHVFGKILQNIARGTTDPGVDIITGGTFQIANLVNRWHHMHLLEIQPLALVRNLVTR